ncbi:glycosyltransferase [Puia sp. P3]|uniref:glycosyltransferase n=1 Tax=Puia sp. P3 TaxID=3423952 RepID=UPI003D67FF2B
MNYSLIRRFRMCWVPDVEGKDGLAGELSHPGKMPDMPVRYVGWLSRFAGRAAGAGQGGGRAASAGPGTGPWGLEGGRGDNVDLLILLSGPEPQRTLLERRLLDQMADYSGRVVLVRGLPAGAPATGVSATLPEGPTGASPRVNLPQRVRVYDHLPADELEELIRGAGQIICRSGYSTVMDLVRLGRRAIMVPTPGQTEQEYLGNYLAARGWAVCIDQKGFSLMDALAAAKGEWGEQGAGEGREMDIPGVRQLPDPAAGEGLLRQAVAEVLAMVRRELDAAREPEADREPGVSREP